MPKLPFRRMYKGNWRYLIFQILLNVPAYLVPLILGTALGVLLDSVRSPQAESLMRAQVFLVVAVLGAVLLSAFRRLYILRAGATLSSRMRSQLLTRLLHCAPFRLLDMRKGDIQTRLFRDIQLSQTALYVSIPALLSEILAGLIAAVYVAVLSWKLALVYAVFFPPCVFLGRRLAAALGTRRRATLETSGDTNAMAEELLAHRRSYVAAGMADTAVTRYAQGLDLEWTSTRLEVLASRRIRLSRFVTEVPPLLTFALGAYLVFAGEITLGTLIAFTQAVVRFDMLMVTLPSHLGTVYTGLESYRRLDEIMHYEQESAGGGAFAYEGELWRFSDLTFRFPGTAEPVLNRFSWQVDAPQRVLVVGPSGCGKTTLLRLLAGYYPAYEGQIANLGHDQRAWQLRALRRHFLYVSSEPSILPGSVYENLTLGEDYSLADVRDTARLCCIDEDILSLPKGYATVLSSAGADFSGGQYARLMLARAVLRRPTVLLLDEITSSLDLPTEETVIRNLLRALPQHTILLVSHRLHLAPLFDSVLVLGAEPPVFLPHPDAYRESALYRKMVDTASSTA